MLHFDPTNDMALLEEWADRVSNVYDNVWVQCVLNKINKENDSDTKNNNVLLEKLHQPLDKFLVEPAWVCPVIEKERIPLDPHQMETQVNKVQQQCWLNLQLQKKRAARISLQTKNWTDVLGLMEGNDWSHNTDGSWFIPAMDLPKEELPSVSATYDKTFHMDGIQVTKCNVPTDQRTENPSANTSLTVQSDTGANVFITADLSILQEVQRVQPVRCESAKKRSTLEIWAIGKYFIGRTLLSVNMYYCPEAHNTIISLTAIVRQH